MWRSWILYGCEFWSGFEAGTHVWKYLLLCLLSHLPSLSASRFCFIFFTPTLSRSTSHPFTPPSSLHRSPRAEVSYCSPCVTSPPPTLWLWSSSRLATCPRLKTMDRQVHILLAEPFEMLSMGSLLTQANPNVCVHTLPSHYNKQRKLKSFYSSCQTTLDAVIVAIMTQPPH